MSKLKAGSPGMVAILSFLLFFSGSWSLPLVDRDEPRFAEASREMRERQDWLIPWFNGDYRFDKPPLIYWCQIAAGQLLGETVLAARLPSVLFASGVAVLLALWGRRLGGARVGWLAALFSTTCLQMLIHARLAVADMPMVFFFLVSVWSGWEWTRPGGPVSRRWWWIFFISLGLGFLAKGPVAWLPLGGLWLGRWRRPREFHLPLGSSLAGLGLTLALIACWGVPALVATHGEFFKVGIGRHVVYRSVGVMEGHGVRGWLGYIATLPFFLLTFFASYLPWACVFPRALGQWWHQRRADAVGWYLLLQAGLVFIVFSLVRTKLPHYTLPALPCLSLWLAREHAAGLAAPSLQPRRWAAIMAAVVAVITLAGFPLLKPFFPAHALARDTRPWLKPEMRFATVEFSEPSLVWEFRSHLTNRLQFIQLEQASNFLAQAGPALLILPTKHLAALSPFPASNQVQTAHATGLNTVKASRVDITAVVKP